MYNYKGSGKGGRRLCREWAAGYCRFGDRCHFLHDENHAASSTNNFSGFKGGAKGTTKGNSYQFGEHGDFARGKGKAKGGALF